MGYLEEELKKYDLSLKQNPYDVIRELIKLVVHMRRQLANR